MFEALRKLSLKKVMVSSVIIGIIGIALVFFAGKYAIGAIGGYTNFEDLKPDEIKNQLVKLDVKLNFGYFSRETSTTKYKSGRTETKTTHYWWVTLTGKNWIFDDEWISDEYLVGIRVPLKYYNDMDDMYDYTYGEGPAVKITLYGEMKKLKPEAEGYFQDWLDTFFDVPVDFDDVALPYYINVYDKTTYDVMGCVLTGAGLILMFIALVRICRASTGATLKKLKKDIADINVSEGSAESDFNSAASYVKNGSLKIGRLFTYYMKGSIPRAIPNSKMLWAYQKTVNHRGRYGITTTTYSIIIFVMGSNKSIELQIPNEAISQEMLKRVDTTLPWVVVGYTDKLKDLFNKNRPQFLELRYNTVEHVAVEPGFESMNFQQTT